MTHLPGLGPESDIPEWLRAHQGRCRSCGAPIVWALTRVDGPRTMPVDPTPNPRGNVRLWVDGGTLRAQVVVATCEASKWGALGGGYVGDPDARWVSHFATCPNANKHRRKR